MKGDLRRELKALGLVAAGAIPGALLRWQLELLAETGNPSLGALGSADLLANLIGCLLIGLLLGQRRPQSRRYLWGGIGFCGSLTTFSSWMLELVKLLDGSRWAQASLLLGVSLLAGLALVQLGYGLGRWASQRPMRATALRAWARTLPRKGT